MLTTHYHANMNMSLHLRYKRVYAKSRYLWEPWIQMVVTHAHATRNILLIDLKEDIWNGRHTEIGRTILVVIHICIFPSKKYGIFHLKRVKYILLLAQRLNRILLKELKNNENTRYFEVEKTDVDRLI